ncbi:MAG TPA: phosphatidylserine decarboxylase family protein [Chitinophagaceae bacterium]|nr:phosphatidylserine decarboxylase family protein [Chitinophagaceae bacterium]
MYIHREGFASIAIAFFVLLVIDVILWLTVPLTTLIGILSFIFLGLFLWIVSFFRIPKREVTIDDDAIIAPADGKVVVIEETVELEYFEDKRLQISIFMSPLNVHCNYNPLKGKVKLTAYHPGKYLVAWHPKSSTMNERYTGVIQHEKHGDVLVRQVAGAMARRIVNYHKEGEEVKQSEELGFIKFGSRVDLFLPTDIDVKINLNEEVKGRQTVIAKFKRE